MQLLAMKGQNVLTLQGLHRAVHVDLREAACVRDELLGQGYADGVNLPWVLLAQPNTVEQLQHEIGNTLLRATPAETGQMLIGYDLVIGRQPSQSDTQLEVLFEHRKEVGAIEDAQGDGREGPRGVKPLSIPHIGLKAEEVSRQHETQNLSSAVREILVQVSPAAMQGIDLRIGAALPKDRASRLQLTERPAERLRRRDLLLAQRLKERELAHATVFATYGPVDLSMFTELFHS